MGARRLRSTVAPVSPLSGFAHASFCGSPSKRGALHGHGDAAKRGTTSVRPSPKVFFFFFFLSFLKKKKKKPFSALTSDRVGRFIWRPAKDIFTLASPSLVCRTSRSQHVLRAKKKEKKKKKKPSLTWFPFRLCPFATGRHAVVVASARLCDRL